MKNRGKKRANQPRSPPAQEGGNPSACRNRSMDTKNNLWAPNFRTAFSTLCFANLFSSWWNLISDCDEVFNYWEPLHYLWHNFGFQTWEYSPVYALRSYVYLGVHGLLTRLATFFLYTELPPKIAFFYCLRTLLAFFCAYTEALFYRSVVHRFGRQVGRYTLFFLLISPGMFLSSTAFLPSSFTMYFTMLVFYAWFTNRHYFGILFGIISVVCGWPYVAVIYIPFALDTIYQRGIAKPILCGAFLLSLFVGLELIVNYHFYGKFVFPALNIIKYNVLQSGNGSTLYGVEPWSFYLLNGFLNFNVVFILALLVGIFPFYKLCYGVAYEWSICPQMSRVLLYMSPMYIWFTIMTIQPHKEERFLYPIYPLFCLSAAFTIRILWDKASFFTKRVLIPRTGLERLWDLLLNGTVFACFLLIMLLSLSRTASNIINYSAPVKLFQEFSQNELEQNRSSTICIGKEWYRFPSSFFLPSDKHSMHFIRSSFRGQLPGHFSTKHNGTRIIPFHMNDQNMEEDSRYFNLENCEYVVDLNLPDQIEHKFWEDDEWVATFSLPFLNASKSKSLFRAFYIPFLTPKHVEFASYVVYKRKAKKK